MNYIYINGRFLSQALTGVQRFAFEITRILLEIRHDIIIIVPKTVDVNGLSIKNWPIKAIGRNSGVLWEQIDLPFFLFKQGSPLLVNFCNSAPIGYRRQIVTVHDVAFLINPRWFSYSFYYWYRIMVPSVLRRSLAIVTVSEFTKSELMRLLKIDGERISVIANAVSDDFKVRSENSDISKREYILTVGSLDPRKNLQSLIDAFEKIGDLDLLLYVVGGGSEKFNFKLLDKYNAKIKFLGRVTDAQLVDLYRHAKVFVYLSLYEGFGVPPLEAMSCGCPVLVSSRSSLREVCGDAAQYVDPQNILMISQNIRAICGDNNIAEIMVDKGYKNLKRFSWRASASNLSKLIDIHLN